jgi:peroxiredoxin
MFNFKRSWAVLLTGCLAVACQACQPKAAQKPERRNPTAAIPSKKVAPKPKTQEPLPPPPSIPKVALSNELRATCLVNVGETMPKAELSDTAGKMRALESLCGRKLTVVCFWTTGATHHSRLAAVAALQDLRKDVVEPFGNKGVAVVGVNVGDAAAALEQEVRQAGASFPNLLDPKGQFFAKIATDKRMPRVFLLDSAGRVLWFDVEYSRSSRHDLTQSIRVVLGEL